MSAAEKYSDIINLEHHVSDRHPRMSLSDRAAQFAPFAALTGYGEAVSETARLTDSERELSEYESDILNRKMTFLLGIQSRSPHITVLFFVSDEKKSGGSYREFSGNIRKIDTFMRSVVFSDGTVIDMDSIFDLQSPEFDNPEFFL